MGLPDRDPTPVIEATPSPGRLWLATGVLVSVALTASACGTGSSASPTSGGQIAFDSDNDVYVMRPDGSARHRLTRDPGLVSDPVWSPDQQQMAFGGSPPGDPAVHFTLINADGTGRRQSVASDSNIGHDWSPDGTKLAFAGQRGDGVGDIYVMNTTPTTATPRS